MKKFLSVAISIIIFLSFAIKVNAYPVVGQPSSVIEQSMDSRFAEVRLPRAPYIIPYVLRNGDIQRIYVKNGVTYYLPYASLELLLNCEGRKGIPTAILFDVIDSGSRGADVTLPEKIIIKYRPHSDPNSQDSSYSYNKPIESKASECNALPKTAYELVKDFESKYRK